MIKIEIFLIYSVHTMLWHLEAFQCWVGESHYLETLQILFTSVTVTAAYEWKWENRYFTSRQHVGAAWRGLLPVCERCHGKGTWPQLRMIQQQSHAPLCHSPMPQNPVGYEKKESWINTFCTVCMPVKQDLY